MKSFEERREEIFRRSDERIRKRTVRRKTLAMCVPLALGVVVFAAALTPRFLTVPGGVAVGNEDGGSASEIALETGSADFSNAGDGGAVTNGAVLSVDSAAFREEIGLITDDPENMIPQSEISEMPVPEGETNGIDVPGNGENESSGVASHRTGGISFTLTDGTGETSYLLDPDGGLLYDLTAGDVYRVPAERLEALCALLESGS